MVAKLGARLVCSILLHYLPNTIKRPLDSRVCQSNALLGLLAELHGLDNLQRESIAEQSIATRQAGRQAGRDEERHMVCKLIWLQ